MSKVLDENLIYQVLSVVEEIPEGYVSTYGTIAYLIDHPKNARLVGKILSMSEYYGDYPCHRVVNASGRLAPNFPLQKDLLEKEGITFKDAHHVDLKKHLWQVK